MTSINIRSENKDDIAAIDTVITSAFLEATHSSHNEQDIVKALRQNSALSISLVAESDGLIIGHVAISPVSISDGTTGWYGLGPISVLPAAQGKGIGSKLMQQAITELKNINATGCVLLGEPNFYGRFGFMANSKFILEGVPAEYFQILSLKSNTTKGKVYYHSAFNI